MGRWASTNFLWTELSCRCGCGTRFVDEEALHKLQALRDLIGKGFTPSSACRCPIHNARVGGAPLSQHRSTASRPSTAFDVPLVVPKEVILSAAREVGFLGLGVSYRTFVHVDNRKTPSRW